MEEGPASNIKDYIINGRKNGFPDSKIIDNLEKTNWPEDVIEAAKKEADTVMPANPEKQEEVTQPIEEKPKQEPVKDELQKPVEESKDMFTKPPKEVLKEEQKPQEQTKEKKGFSVYALIAFLLSPIPVIGIYISLSAIESVRKKKQSGLILAILGLIISLGIMLFLIYAMAQIFSLNPEQLTGFSKFINDNLNLVS